jgi:hypothetical protein
MKKALLAIVSIATAIWLYHEYRPAEPDGYPESGEFI